MMRDVCSYLVTLAVAVFGAERARTSRPAPALVTVALQCGRVAAAVAATGAGTQGEGVGGVEAQEVVVGVTEQMKQHLERGGM